VNEFSRLFRLDALSAEPIRVEIEAGLGERESLARRFGLVAIDALTADAELRRSGEAVTAAGRLRARVTQSCVGSAEPVEAEVTEDFQVDFRPMPTAIRPEEEIELGEGELDTVRTGRRRPDRCRRPVGGATEDAIRRRRRNPSLPLSWPPPKSSPPPPPRLSSRTSSPRKR
jgi:hypothetical protein